MKYSDNSKSGKYFYNFLFFWLKILTHVNVKWSFGTRVLKPYESLEFSSEYHNPNNQNIANSTSVQNCMINVVRIQTGVDKKTHYITFKNAL